MLRQKISSFDLTVSYLHDHDGRLIKSTSLDFSVWWSEICSYTVAVFYLGSAQETVDIFRSQACYVIGFHKTSKAELKNVFLLLLYIYFYSSLFFTLFFLGFFRALEL